MRYYEEKRFTYSYLSLDILKPKFNMNVPMKLHDSKIVKDNLLNVQDLFLKIISNMNEIYAQKQILNSLYFDSEKKPVLDKIVLLKEENEKLFYDINLPTLPYKWSIDKEDEFSYTLYLN